MPLRRPASRSSTSKWGRSGRPAPEVRPEKLPTSMAPKRSGRGVRASSQAPKRTRACQAILRAVHLVSCRSSVGAPDQPAEAGSRVSKTTPDAPAALPTKTRLPKIAKETARLVVGMIAATPYLSDESSTSRVLNGPSITFDDCVPSSTWWRIPYTIGAARN